MKFLNKIDGADKLKQDSNNRLVTDEQIANWNNKADKDYVDAQLTVKVDKVSGKQLSTEDYTTTEKNKLAGIENGANKTTINNTLTSTSTTQALSARQGKTLKDDLDAHKAKKMHQVVIIERDMSVGGWQSMGLDFTPDLVIVTAYVNDSEAISFGMAGANGHQYCTGKILEGSLAGKFRGGNFEAIRIYASSSNVTRGVVDFATNGINWAKTGDGGSGTARIMISAFRHA